MFLDLSFQGWSRLSLGETRIRDAQRMADLALRKEAPVFATMHRNKNLGKIRRSNVDPNPKA